MNAETGRAPIGPCPNLSVGLGDPLCGGPIAWDVAGRPAGGGSERLRALAPARTRRGSAGSSAAVVTGGRPAPPLPSHRLRGVCRVAPTRGGCGSYRLSLWVLILAWLSTGGACVLPQGSSILTCKASDSMETL